jgi:pyruvate-ferredoxin/flavodoxin oxidoreductase
MPSYRVQQVRKYLASWNQGTEAVTDKLPNAPRFPGVPSVIHGNGAIAEVMSHVCGGVIGFPITPSTEISEIYEAFRAAGGCNVWGQHPFFFEPEGEHSAQSGALGAALTGGKYVSNASSSQGILYGLESHYVTVGKRVGGFVLQVAARVVSKHSLNVMAGHDDVYALLQAGYTILFGSNPQEAADLAAISYKVAAQSLIPVTNAMDGFTTSHMLCETLMPEPSLLKEFLGNPSERIQCPTVAQEILFGAKGRVYQLKRYLAKHRDDLVPADLKALEAFLEESAEAVEKDNDGKRLDETLAWVPEELRAPWRRQWLNAYEKGTRQRVPALVDVHNPGLTGPVQNQSDFQAGSADHRAHFVCDVPRLTREAMAEYSQLTGREYTPIKTYFCDDAESVMLGLGSVTDDAQAVAKYLRNEGKRVGVISVKLLQPFPEAEVAAALKGKRAVTVLERSDALALSNLVIQTLFKAHENLDGTRHRGIPAIKEPPKVTTAIFGLGAHDLQPRHLAAAYKNMEGKNAPLVYLGSQFFSKSPPPHIAALQEKLRAAYPETELMALETESNPNLLPRGALRIRFHSVGGYGTMATGKLLTDILTGVLDLHSKAAPKYGSEKSGSPTNYYITLSPEPVLPSNAEIEDVEIVVSPDHKVFAHSNPLRGLIEGGTFILQSDLSPIELWKELPLSARKTLRDRKIRFFVLDGFAVAKRCAPAPELETRMMGIAFIGAVCGHVKGIASGASQEAMLEKVRKALTQKFGAKGSAVVEGNLTVIKEAFAATRSVDYTKPEFAETQKTSTKAKESATPRTAAISAAVCRLGTPGASANFLDAQYFEDIVARPFRDGTIAEAPVFPGAGLFMPAASAAVKDKGLFRRSVPEFDPSLCTGCIECALACPDAAIPNTVHEIHELLQAGIEALALAEPQREALRGEVPALSQAVREVYRQGKSRESFRDVLVKAIEKLDVDSAILRRNLAKLAQALAIFPVARTRPFFDAMEKATPGSGGLYSVTIDPWKCSGCLECVDVCGPHALIEREQDAAQLESLQARFELLSRLPNTPSRFVEDATRPDGETKRLMLDLRNYYATTGGHGACRGCGEVTAIRLVSSANQAMFEPRRKAHIRELEDLIARLSAKQASVADAARRERIGRTVKALEKRLFRFETGPSENGPAASVIANATGCSSVYASTLPFNPYNGPWVNSLFQDAPALAKGIFEGLAVEASEDVRALRTARLELTDEYDPQLYDRLFLSLGWNDFTAEELALMPTVLSIGGDGATYDIGFGSLSRVLATSTPIKFLVLNSGVYSNTGGQASTASLTGQDSDLSRFGAAHAGKQEARKELALIAAFHPNVFVVQSCTALQGHFLNATLRYLTHNDSPALLDVYTPCQAEQGIADAAASRHARMAVESRTNPVFVHDPHRGPDLHSRFVLEGNPEIEKDWTTSAIEYVEDGATKLMNVPYTPADFARTEARFKKHFRTLPDGAPSVAIADYVDLPDAERAGKTPYVWATDAGRRLIKLEVSHTLVHLVEERRRHWRTLQYLAGIDVRRLEQSHHSQLEALKAEYQAAVAAREASLDSLVRGMTELAASSSAPSNGSGPLLMAAAPAPQSTAASTAAGGTGAALVRMDEADLPKCNNCKNCYQSCPELFEKTTIIVDGATKEVGRLISGILNRINVTPELRAKVARVAANCDSEIIHVR